MYESYWRPTPWYVELWRDWLGLFRGDWIEITFGIIIGLIAAAIGLAILYGIFRAADRWFTPKEVGPGRITKRWVIAGYWRSTTTTEWKYHYCFSSGKFEYGPVSVAGPPEWVPDQPMVEVTLVNGEAAEEFAVTQGAYDVAGMQRPVHITFQRGRFSGTVYISSYENA